jgi:hypothetical protein
MRIEEIVDSVADSLYRYSSIRNARMTEELRQAITSQQRIIETASSTVEQDVIHVQRALADSSLDGEQNNRVDAEQIAEVDADRNREADDGQNEAREDAHLALEMLEQTLQITRELLAELSLKTKDQEISRVAASRDSNTITFGTNNQGMQVGVTHGSVTWNGRV